MPTKKKGSDERKDRGRGGCFNDAQRVERPRVPGGVAAFMAAHSKTPRTTPSVEFSSVEGVVRGSQGAAADVYLATCVLVVGVGLFVEEAAHIVDEEAREQRDGEAVGVPGDTTHRPTLANSGDHTKKQKHTQRWTQWTGSRGVLRHAHSLRGAWEALVWRSWPWSEAKEC